MKSFFSIQRILKQEKKRNFLPPTTLIFTPSLIPCLFLNFSIKKREFLHSVPEFMNTSLFSLNLLPTPLRHSLVFVFPHFHFKIKKKKLGKTRALFPTLVFLPIKNHENGKLSGLERWTLD